MKNNIIINYCLCDEVSCKQNFVILTDVASVSLRDILLGFVWKFYKRIILSLIIFTC